MLLFSNHNYIQVKCVILLGEWNFHEETVPWKIKKNIVSDCLCAWFSHDQYTAISQINPLLGKDSENYLLISAGFCAFQERQVTHKMEGWWKTWCLLNLYKSKELICKYRMVMSDIESLHIVSYAPDFTSLLPPKTLFNSHKISNFQQIDMMLQACVFTCWIQV